MSQVLDRRGFLRTSMATAALAVAAYYGLDFKRLAAASAKSGILAPTTDSMPTTVPTSVQIPHLLRRAGFGGSPSEISAYTQMGFSNAVNQLVNYESVDNSQLPSQPNITMSYTSTNTQADLMALEAWWLDRMVRTNRPLEEKMTLFWHNHFATAISKVQSVYLMYNQNQFLRQNALGNFNDILTGITLDPAMQIWLDLAGSDKTAPNENYAREVMEVFTTGVGPYTQTDVVNGAKAFTGFVLNKTTDAVTFVESRHDQTNKTFLGSTGNFGPQDIINILVARPETATNLCTELFEFFAYANPSQDTINNLSNVYFSSGYSIKAVVNSILSSDEFLSGNAYLNKVKSPTEFVANATRSLGATVNLWQNAKQFGADEGYVEEMGQMLFDPPSVFGWPSDMGWIDSGTLMQRYNFPMRIQTSADNSASGLDPNTWFASGGTLSDNVSNLTQVVIPDGLPADILQVIEDSTSTLSNPVEMTKNVVRLTMCTPYYNLN